MAQEVARGILPSDKFEFRRVHPENILLDEANPRLASGLGGDTQEELLRILWKEMAVDEVALSIAANGFFPEEPLLVIPKDPKENDSEDRNFIVVEGNRRLAAVMLLRSRRLREKHKATDLPDIDKESRKDLDYVPVHIYKNRKLLWTYCGFRHINGIKPWDAFSKAKYVAKVCEDYNITLKEIAEKIGDKHSTVKRLYRGYTVLEQAEKRAGFDIEDRAKNRFSFSHLYTALSYQEFQSFLGIEPETLKSNPIPKSKLEELSELMTWLYGKKSAGIEPVIRTQNPDLNTLREIIAKPAALAALRKGYALERSHEVALGDKRRFREALTSAKEELQQAKGTVTTGYSGEKDLYKTMEDIMVYSGKIQEEMEAKLK